MLAYFPTLQRESQLPKNIIHLIPRLLTSRRLQIAHRGLHVRSVRATVGRCVNRRQPTNSGLQRSHGTCEARSSLCRASRRQQRHHAFGGVVAIQVNLNVCYSGVHLLAIFSFHSRGQSAAFRSGRISPWAIQQGKLTLNPRRFCRRVSRSPHLTFRHLWVLIDFFRRLQLAKGSEEQHVIENFCTSSKEQRR